MADSGERVRGWDSCMYPMFTQHASGHNPRPNQAARWRQRTMHKFEYLPRNVGLYGCVGCGRCVQSCPVRLDIRHVLRRRGHAALGDHAEQQAKVGETEMTQTEALAAAPAAPQSLSAHEHDHPPDRR